MKATCSGFQSSAAQRREGELPRRARLVVLDRAHQVRREALAAGGDASPRPAASCSIVKRVVALADAERDRLAGVPLLRFLLLVGGALPLGRRQRALELALQVDAGQAAEAERRHEVVHRVDAEVVGEHVVVGVARLDDRLVHVDRAVAAFLVVAKAVVAEVEVAGVEDRLLRRPLAERQRGQRHERLVGRAGRIGAAQRPVEERLVGRLVERAASSRRRSLRRTGSDRSSAC